MDNIGADFVPSHLPCGKRINENYEPGKIMQCCRTECPDKSDKQIEVCYDMHKYGYYRDLKPFVSQF